MPKQDRSSVHQNAEDLAAAEFVRRDPAHAFQPGSVDHGGTSSTTTPVMEGERLLERLGVGLVDEHGHPESEVDDSSLRLDLHSIELLLRSPSLSRPGHIQRAIRRADYEDAAVRTLACTMLKNSIPAQLIADVLIGVTDPGVFIALGRRILRDEVQLLLDLVQRGRFATNAAGTEQIALALFLLWKLELPDLHPMLVGRLRGLARTRWLLPRAAAVAIWLARRLGDSNVETIYALTHGALTHGVSIGELVTIFGDFISEVSRLAIEDVVALLPRQTDHAVIPTFPVRAAPRAGRNEPCLCGSGKKYKRCCADKPGMTAVVAPLRIEQLRRVEPNLDENQLARLSRTDLAQLNLTRLQDAAVLYVMSKQAELRDWERVCLAVDELARRRGAEFADAHLKDVIGLALSARLFDVAEKLMNRLQSKTEQRHLRFEIDLATHAPDALGKLEAEALAALADERRGAIELAFTTLEAMPALGILIARGAIVDNEDGDVLLDVIEEARDLLLLPPGDPVQARFGAVGAVRQDRVLDIEQDHTQLTRTAAELRAKLDDASERLAALQRQVGDRERDLGRAERAAQEHSQRLSQSPADQRDQRILRDKIDELQARIREGNAERLALRRRLSEAAAGTDSSGAAQAATRPALERYDEEESDAAEPLPVVSTSRSLLFTQFVDNAKTALAAVPRKVATHAMHIVTSLATGDPAAWRVVKQAKETRRQVLMARVGIHHRLLFRVEGNALEVLDLVTRESLLTTLKRLRAG